MLLHLYQFHDLFQILGAWAPFWIESCYQKYWKIVYQKIDRFKLHPAISLSVSWSFSKLLGAILNWIMLLKLLKGFKFKINRSKIMLQHHCQLHKVFKNRGRHFKLNLVIEATERLYTRRLIDLKYILQHRYQFHEVFQIFGAWAPSWNNSCY